MVGKGALIGVLAALLAGCASAPGDADQPWLGEPFEQRVDAAIEEARASDASEAQLAILERAKEVGEVTLEDARVAALAAVECLQSAGLEAEYYELSRKSGLVVPSYRVATPEDSVAADPLIDACQDREFEWVTLLFQLQPSSQQLNGEYVMTKEDVLRECLDEAGMSPDPEANGWELAMFAVEDANFHAGGSDCLDEAEIDGL